MRLLFRGRARHLPAGQVYGPAMALAAGDHHRVPGFLIRAHAEALRILMERETDPRWRTWLAQELEQVEDGSDGRP